MMLVWNYNEESPGEMFGAKDVNVAVSQDGVAWTNMGTFTLNEAPGDNTCSANSAVDLNGAAAKFVQITFLTSWADMDIYGLSEVRFSAMPTRAGEPFGEFSPEDADTNITVEPELSWKAGRDAVEHHLYLSTDMDSVAENIVSPVILNEASYAPAVELDRTYYWKVDEVNNAEDYPVWDGPVWSFSTIESLVVENFEVGYDDSDVNAVWATWIGGYNNPNTNGGRMGNDAAPYLSTDNYNGGHSAPLYYNHSDTAINSEVKAKVVDLPIGTTDWTIGSPRTLVIWIMGDPANNKATDRLYVKVGNAKIPFTGDISVPRWTQWNIPLSTPGINLGNVSTLAVGVDKIGPSGGGTHVVLIDDIRLYRKAPALPTEEIWIEAESGTITPPFEIFTELAGAIGGQYIGKADGGGNNSNSPPDPNAVATYSFTVSGGVYMIDLRWLGVGSSDGFWVQIPEISDASAIKTAAGADVPLVDGWLDGNNLRPRSSEWHWSYVLADDLGGDPDVQFILPAGTYTLKFANRDDGTMLDAFVITKVADLP